MGKSGSEPGFLKRLRKAVQLSGLTADQAALEEPAQVLLVSSRLAQTALHHLHSVNLSTEGQLAGELATMGSAEECELLTHGRGYTFLHVVHFLYEYVRHYSGLEDGRSFPAEVGWEGSGLHLEYDTDIITMMRLLVNAMPPGDEERNLGLIVEALTPLLLDKIFPNRLFAMEVELQGSSSLRFDLHFADPEEFEKGLKGFGLEKDAGAFFINSALQIQETIRKGVKEMVCDAERHTALDAPIEERDRVEQIEIVRTCRCAWKVTWDADLKLRLLTDPEEVLELIRTLHSTLHRRDLEYFQERVKTLEMRVQELEEGDRFHDLIGRSPQMRRVYRIIEQVAATDSTVLIRGESGTGKELVAHAIHQSSPRREQPFVAVNCAAFTESLLESELFGHEKGAFTGADRTKPGRFELADGGTLFLDEVGDIPLTTQVKLLRALETQTFERVGGTRSITTDVRFIGATNRDLEERIEEGEFREDFYFRLNVLPVNLPSLREHREDIPQLAHHFIERIGRKSGKPGANLSRGAIRRLVEHPWPGNIRELQNVIERGVAVYAREDTLTEGDIVQALGLQIRGTRMPDLNLRQQEILGVLARSLEGCRVEELMAEIGQSGSRGGGSVRTLQNDLRKLAERGYANWVKDGSARVYAISSEGEKLIREMG